MLSPSAAYTYSHPRLARRWIAVTLAMVSDHVVFANLAAGSESTHVAKP